MTFGCVEMSGVYCRRKVCVHVPFHLRSVYAVFVPVRFLCYIPSQQQEKKMETKANQETLQAIRETRDFLSRLLLPAANIRELQSTHRSENNFTSLST